MKSDDLSANTALEVRRRMAVLNNGVCDSYPLDIGLVSLKSIPLPPLMWSKFDKTPLDMTICNTGLMLNIQTEFAGQRPTLTGSVLQCPFEFQCLRIHWGAKSDEGNEYRVMGNRFPMEIHLVFHRVNGLLTNEAQLDGNEDTLILVYTCKLCSDENAILKDLVSNLKQISEPGESSKINPFPLSSLFDCKTGTYLMHWDSSNDDECRKSILRIISSRSVSINKSQLTSMRSLKTPGSTGVTPNSRPRSGSAPRYQILYNVTPQADFPVENLLRASARGGFRLPALDSRDGRPEEEEDPRQTALTPSRRPENSPGLESPTTATVVDTVRSHRPEDTGEPDELAELLLEFWQDDTIVDKTTLSPSSTHENPPDGDAVITKDSVISSINSLISDLSDDAKTKFSTCSNRVTVEKTHREGVRMNSTALRREMHIKNKLHELNLHKK